MAKIIISFDKYFNDLSGKPMDPETTSTMGRTLAAFLSQQTEGDALKLHFWSLDLFAGKSVEIDKSDFIILRAIVEKGKLPTMVKAPLLVELDSAKDIADKAV